MRYADLHCDLLRKLKTPHDWSCDPFKFHLTSDTLSSGVFLQTFAVFAPNQEATMSEFYEKYDLFRALQKRAELSGVVCVFSVENGAFLEKNIENVEKLENCGVKFLTLVWNGGNALGGAHDGTDRGLTPFGKEVCERLFAGGKILPDVSHLSDKGIEAVDEMAKLYGAPYVATHSGARALCGHSRNLTDGQIRAIADAGGVIGVPFYPPFLGDFSPANHAAHIVNVGGEDCAAIGSDFDGVERSCYKNPCEAAEALETALRSVGFSPRQTEKILQKNALRVIGKL